VAPAGRCSLELELLGRHPQWHGKGKAPVCFEATHIHDSPITTLDLNDNQIGPATICAAIRVASSHIFLFVAMLLSL
jgi:hypothetical protein